MKEFAALVRKEFRHIFRDLRTILIVLITPVVQILLFGFAISTEVKNARVDIVGDITDPDVRSLVQKIDNSKYLSVRNIYTDIREVGPRFKSGRADAAVCFSRNFGSSGDAQVRILGDGSDPNTAQMIVSYINGVINSGSSGNDALAEVRYMYNPGMESSYNFVPGVMGLILMLICSMMTAISIVREKESGSMELLLVSPVRPLWIIISKTIPYLTLSLVNVVTILLLSHYVMDVPIRGSLALLFLVSLVFILTSLGIGLLISIISSDQRTALLICGMGLTMPTMIFSGIIFPCESMPVILQRFSDIIPAKWYIIMVRKIMIEGVGFTYFCKEFIILAFMMAALVAISVFLFKKRV